MFEIVEGAAGLLAEQVSVIDVILQTNGGDDDLFVLSVLGFGVGLFLIYRGVETYRKSRLIADTATQKVRSVAVGQAELEGRSRPIGEPLRAPFTEEQCLYANWEIAEYRRDPGDDDKSWDTVASGSYTEPFLLEDDTGAIVIDPETDGTWELTSGCSSEWRVGSGAQPNELITAFCERQGLRPWSSNRRRYSQKILPLAESVYVFGESVPSDIEVEDDALAGAGTRLKIKRDTDSGRLIVSNMTEERLVSFYTTRAPLYVFGGLALSAVCLFIVLTMLL